MATKTVELTPELALEKIADGVTRKSIQEEFGISGQKLSALIRKAKQDEKDKVTIPADEMIPASAFAKSTSVIADASMGDSVVMTMAEYDAYSKANGMHRGRKLGTYTQMNTGEVRIMLNMRSRGLSANDMKESLLAKHGASEFDLYKVIIALCKEEESEVVDLMRQFNINQNAISQARHA